VPFPSHVRNAFKRSGGSHTERHDATGELVRLLDDLSTEFRWIAGRARETYAKPVETEPLTAALITQQLYFALCHDGYACLLVSKDQPEPMSLPPDMPSGSYVIVLVSLDADDKFAPAEGLMGSLFSVYKRKTAPGRAGRREDLQVHFADQIAAGYALYGSSTQLCYTMRGNPGVYRFVLHPVAKQFFMCWGGPLEFGAETGRHRRQLIEAVPAPTESGTGSNVITPVFFAARETFLGSDALAQALRHLADQHEYSTVHTGCLIGDFHTLMQKGGILVADKVDLLCEAAPLAYLAEESGARATNEHGERILDQRLSGEDPLHAKTRLLIGSSTQLAELERLIKQYTSTSGAPQHP
jgi:fructose-1,6-bisphosphatase I